MPVIFVGMSGGIDSSAAAVLLKNDGYDVVGVTFTAVGEEGIKKCCSIEEIFSAKKVCAFLNIPHKVIDIRDIFEAKIIKYFIDGYKSGLTPNPCVYCNRLIKFGALMEYSIAEGADFFATGHYAGIREINGEYFIHKGKDTEKDQSYFLSYVDKEKLPLIKLPIGGFLKREIRQYVRDMDLPINPHKSESQDICFVQNDYRDFLRSRGVEEKPGYFVYLNKTAGLHNGIPFYSLGQRRGLGVAVGKRVFVREFDPEKNLIKIGEKPFSKKFIAVNMNIFTDKFTDGNYSVQIRYRSDMINCSVRIMNMTAEVLLEKAQEIVTPGQFAVFYKDGLVYASGVIEKTDLIS